MKIFRGVPGDPPTVTVSIDDVAVFPIHIDAPLPWWGNSGLGVGPKELSLAIAKSVLEDDMLALKIHQRLKYRVVAQWRSDQPWSITADQVKAQVDDILRIERESQSMVAAIAREPVPVVMEGGLGIAGKTPADDPQRR